jgi:hypothetical protein
VARARERPAALASEIGTIETAKHASGSGVLGERPAWSIAILDLLQPEPTGLIGTLLERETAWRCNTAGEVVEQARRIGQRLALPIDRVADLAGGGVPRRDARLDDLEDECPLVRCAVVSCRPRDTIDTDSRRARAAAQLAHLVALDRRALTAKQRADRTGEHRAIKWERWDSMVVRVHGWA